MSYIVTLERTESFTVVVEDAKSEHNAIQAAKGMIQEDTDNGGRWSDSLEFTFEDAWED